MKLKLSPDGIEAGSTMTAGDGAPAVPAPLLKPATKKPKRAANPKAAKKRKATPQELPLGKAKGVAPLSIAEVNTAISEYEDAKEARCAESPKELEKKRALFELLHLPKNKKRLPVNKKGFAYYRRHERDYELKETLSVRDVSDNVPEED